MSENSFPLKPSTTQLNIMLWISDEFKSCYGVSEGACYRNGGSDIPSQLQVSLIGESELTSVAVVQQSYLDSEPC